MCGDVFPAPTAQLHVALFGRSVGHGTRPRKPWNFSEVGHTDPDAADNSNPKLGAINKARTELGT